MWLCALFSYCASWETRRCLLAGRSLEEGEVGWSIVAFGIKCKRHCTRGSFIAGNVTELLSLPALSSTAFKRVSERVPQLLTLDLTCCSPRVTQFNVEMGNRRSLETKTCGKYLMIVCKCNFDGLDGIKQPDFVEAERGITVNKPVQRGDTDN